jgi:hypothetical protein
MIELVHETKTREVSPLAGIRLLLIWCKCGQRDCVEIPYAIAANS